MSNYRKGTDFERWLRGVLKEAGMSVTRAAGSKGYYQIPEVTCIECGKPVEMKCDLKASLGGRHAYLVVVSCKRRG